MTMFCGCGLQHQRVEDGVADESATVSHMVSGLTSDRAAQARPPIAAVKASVCCTVSSPAAAAASACAASR